MGFEEKIIMKFLAALMLVMFSVFAEANCKSLIVVGMEDERAIAAGDDVIVVVGAANATTLRNRLSTINISDIGAVYSFGVAGGLDPTLKPGDLLFSVRVLMQNPGNDSLLMEQSWESSPQLLATYTVIAKNDPALTFRRGIFLGSDLEARDNPATGNQGLREKTGADIIDNESHIAANFAAEHQLPFIAVRAVSDSVNKPLPPAALIALEADGSPDGKAILKSILKDPLQIPALVRTAIDYQKSLDALKAFRVKAGFIRPANCAL